MLERGRPSLAGRLQEHLVMHDPLTATQLADVAGAEHPGQDTDRRIGRSSPEDGLSATAR